MKPTPTFRWMRPGFAAQLTLIGLAAMIHAAPAEAQASWSVEADNDAFNTWLAGSWSDMDYTGGTRVRMFQAGRSPVGKWLFNHVEGCGIHAGSGPCQDWSLVISQEVYTPPTNHVLREPGDRAYAGWLGAALQTRVHGDRLQHGFSLTLGVTGDPSLAAPTQRFLHHFFGEPVPPGWDRQLGTEPTVDLGYDGSLDLLRTRPASWLGARLTPLWAITVGTVHREAALGVEGALELGASGASRWRQFSSATDAPGVYVVGAIREHAVAGNLFLDGGFFSDGPSVGHKTFVRSLELGMGVRAHGIGLEWRFVRNSREYALQSRPHAYTTLALTL